MASSNLIVTEVMFNPGSRWNDDYKWIELYNNSDQAVDLTGYVFDIEGGIHRFDQLRHVPNLSGVIQPFSTGVLHSTVTTVGTQYLSSPLTPFPEIWNPNGDRDINFIPVVIAVTEEEFTRAPAGLGIRSASRLGIWDSVAAYDNRNFDNAIVNFRYTSGRNGFPDTNNASSMYLTTLDGNPSSGDNWKLSVAGVDGAFSVASNVLPNANTPNDPQGFEDIGSPGFVPFGSTQPGPAPVLPFPEIPILTFEQFAQFEAISGRALPFDEGLYLLANPDVAAAIQNGVFASGAQHYNQFGAFEGRPLLPIALEFGGIKLSALFDEQYYLSQNPDIAGAVTQGALPHGFKHFVAFGITEGRDPSGLYNEDYYRDNNPDVDAAVGAGTFSSGLIHYLLFGHIENRTASELFDPEDYLLNNPDVGAAIATGGLSSAFEHLIESGLKEGRQPGVLLYEEAFYLSQNPDVASAVASGGLPSGYVHYVSYGQKENRDPSSLFDESAYLSANPDVAAAVSQGIFSSGFHHYFKAGRGEERPLA